MICCTDSPIGITPERPTGFSVGWPNPPSPETRLRLLNGSDLVVLSVDRDANRVGGFVTAISAGVLGASIPLLEVLPDSLGSGIGTELMGRVLTTIDGHSMIDLLRDPKVQPFYERLGVPPPRAC